METKPCCELLLYTRVSLSPEHHLHAKESLFPTNALAIVNTHIPNYDRRHPTSRNDDLRQGSSSDNLFRNIVTPICRATPHLGEMHRQGPQARVWHQGYNPHSTLVFVRVRTRSLALFEKSLGTGGHNLLRTCP